MHIIKLSAIESTNTFLKELVSDSVVENCTVVTAESQLSGRGQMGTIWESEGGKNLMFSVFFRFDDFLLKDSVYLNYSVSMAVYNSLKELNIPKLKIKWPNDILSDNKKICGILIENSISTGYINSAIIGVGLNVNQDSFSEQLTQAASIKNILGISQDRDKLLSVLIANLKHELELCTRNNFVEIKQKYLANLYKIGVPTMFENSNGIRFMGKIVGVDSVGSVEIELTDESIKSFGLKEVKILR